MATATTYVGVSSKARKVKNIYVGVSSKARKVTKVYAGVSGKARLVYSADWYTAGGISKANCLAAYQFKGAASETAALTDLTGHGYTLTKANGQASWSAANGVYRSSSVSAYNCDLNNESLHKSDIKSYVFRYANFTKPENTNEWAIVAYGSDKNAVFYLSNGSDKNPGFYYNSNSGFVTGSFTTPATAVFGVTMSQKTMYKNGTAVTTTIGTKGEYTPEYGIGIFNLRASYKDVYFYAIAFYSVDLTAAQHKAVATAMLAL